MSDAPLATPYTVRAALPADVEGARRLMLDTFYEEFGYGYVPAWHRDVVDLAATYLDDPRHLLLVAVCDGEVVATTGVRSGGPNHPPHPRWLVERYPPVTTAQIVRVYVRTGHRRHGLARELVRRACDFAAGTPGYDSIYLHTNVNVEGAEAFWRSVAKEVFDARTTGEHGPGVSTVHFEIPMPH
ncbi:GNAT family N-acetyltransferase [Streptomyces chumphonensis]|uniref:GNAT family N-acetyltransferase n=1 Tax=Streptomyces chumphonensis TaxID=1214925 RepID=A0A927EV45_9ACTN|nr:GNAT family N-acetyltransferase [Streptomyces chumphonensis]MBD3930354.1 GNAT family N-acetyltransferase [Streptomyces chumphonensis]